MPSPESAPLTVAFEGIDRDLLGLEARIAHGEALPLVPTVDGAIALVGRMIRGYLVAEGRKPPPPEGADLLDAWKVLVKGEPAWNAIRDNCRELVYYRNCINMNRLDALPAVPERMAVRTARHIYLYIKTRLVREGRLQD
jgi:hypothetical protein